MDFLLKAAYYGISGLSTLVVGFFFLANLFDMDKPGETWVHKAVLLASGIAAIALLAGAWRFGHQQGHWITGALLAGAAVLAFFVMMVGGLLLFTKVHWQ